MFDLIKWIGDHIKEINNRNNNGCDHSYKPCAEIRAPLTGGRYTSFMLLQCDKCPEKTGFPTDNLTLAIEEGTEETRKQLIELGLIDIDVNTEVNTEINTETRK